MFATATLVRAIAALPIAAKGALAEMRRMRTSLPARGKTPG
jgi:hypothetical protein